MARSVSVASDPLTMMRKLAVTRRAQAEKLIAEAVALEELVAKLSPALPLAPVAPTKGK